MSRHAAARAIGALRSDVSRGLRLALVLVIPGSLLLLAAAGPICVAILRGNASVSAVLIGQVLAVFALALVPFTVQQVLLRSFYAQNDSRTPALVTCAVTVVLVISDLIISSAVAGSQRVVGLAAGFGIAYLAGALVSVRLARDRLGGRGARVLRLAVRVLLVSGVAVGLGWVLAVGAGALVQGQLGPTARALVELVILGSVTVCVYVSGTRRLRIAEAAPLRSAAGLVLDSLPVLRGLRGRAQPR
jgi:putative peptidoglycan lipid II flippase